MYITDAHHFMAELFEQGDTPVDMRQAEALCGFTVMRPDTHFAVGLEVGLAEIAEE